MLSSELEGAQLDYWVAKALGMKKPSSIFTPSTRWQQGGPLIEEYRVYLQPSADRKWWASMSDAAKDEQYEMKGSTPLIAACRCIVASKYGESVDA